MLYKKHNKTVFASAIILSAMFVLSYFFLFTASSGQESNIIEPIDSKPYGLSYGEWSVKWWQWVLSIPEDKNPIKDRSGTYCGINQNNPHVWFLVGSGGGEVVRSCTVPTGKAIFFPIMTAEWSFAESPTSKTEDDLRIAAHEDQNTVTALRLIIDGVDIQNLTKYRTDSPLFNFTTPDEGLFDLNSVSTQSVSDGFFIMLKPLSPGAHQVTYSGVLGSVTTSGSQIAPEMVTYHLTIE